MTRERPNTQRSHPRVSSQNRSAETALPDQSRASPRSQPERTGQSNSLFSSGFLMNHARQDALIVEEAGECWLHSRWTISGKTLERATSAMGRDAHRACRQLRLFCVEQDDSGPRCKELIDQIELPANAEEWFQRVPSPEHAWVVEIGMSFGNGRFFSMLHSVPVTLNGSRVSLQAAERLLGCSSLMDSLDGGEPPPLKVQGAFVLNGSTRPGAHASIDDQYVPVDPQTGQFEWQLPLSNGRVVVPVNVVDAGKTQRALLAIDLNFHLLDPEPNSDR